MTKIDKINCIIFIGLFLCLSNLSLILSIYLNKPLILFKNQNYKKSIEIYNCSSNPIYINQTEITEQPCENQICNCEKEYEQEIQDYEEQIQTLFNDLNTCCDYCV
jgi:hypothetical protein